VKKLNERKHAVTGVLNDIDADIIAFQEMETFIRAAATALRHQGWSQIVLKGSCQSVRP